MARKDLTRSEMTHRAHLGFGIHFGVYVAVIGGLAALMFTRNPEGTWWYWVLGGWGLGVMLHALLVFQPTILETLIERRMARRN